MADTTKSNVNRDTREINRETTGRDIKDTNPDLITGAPGSHPIGTGVGAAAGGTGAALAGAAIGAAISGPAAPIGAAIGAVVGAIGGGLAGKGVAETIDPTAEDAYWKETHKTRDYAKGSGKDYSYDKDYKPAYQYGWESTGKHAGKSFDQAEPDLAKGWDSARGESKLSWDHAKHATRDAWDRLSSGATGERRSLDAGAHETVPVLKENLQVGKQEVQTGGVRVHSEVVERPVEAQVNLREEEVHVNRRAVDRPVSPGDATAFRESTIEMTEKAEVPVVSKQARVVEEVVIGKEASQHTETVRDNVRETVVDVEPTSGGTAGMTAGTAAGAATRYQPFDTYGTQFRTHWQQRFESSPDERYELHEPAYRYGYNLATDERYRDVNDWGKVETSARSSWEKHNPGSWDRFKDSVRHAWSQVRGR